MKPNKKKSIIIAISGLIVLIIIFPVVFKLVAGLVIDKTLDRHPSTKKEVIEYLEEKYPDETFEILSKENIEIDNEDAEECRGTFKGHKWKVKSKETNITFIVEDGYSSTTMGVCNFSLHSDYKDNNDD